MAATAALLDDDPRLRQLLHDQLEQEGLRILPGEPDRRGLASIDIEAVDLVVMDIVMPHCDGFELLREIRKRRLRMPVIAYSRGVPTYVEAARKLGATEAVAMDSPAGFRTLVERVRHIANDLGRCA